MSTVQKLNGANASRDLYELYIYILVVHDARIFLNVSAVIPAKRNKNYDLC